MDVRRLPVGNQMLAGLLKLYPFLSGCGTLANSRLVRAIDTGEARNVVARVVGGEAVVPSTDYVARAMIYVGDIDRKVSRVLDACIEPGDHALDIGANLGLVTLRMAARVGPSGHVHAFEPMPRMVAYLKASLARNPGLPVTLHEIGLGAARETLDLHVPRINLGRASFLDTPPEILEETVAVPVHPLTDYVREAGIGRVDIVKIDVEGFEEQVLLGARGLFASAMPRAVVLEEHDFKDPSGPLPPSLEMLHGLGYDLYALPKRLLKLALVPIDHPDAVKAHDYLALAPEGSARVRTRLGLPARG